MRHFILLASILFIVACNDQAEEPAGACMLRVTDSLTALSSTGDTVTMYVSDIDTFQIAKIDRTFWVVEYEFKDTTVLKLNIEWIDSTVYFYAYRYDTVYADSTIIVNPPAPFTYVRIKGYSTICEGEHANLYTTVNGGTEFIIGSGIVPLDFDGWHLMGLSINQEDIENISFAWDEDCFHPELTPPEDRNIFIEQIDINGIDYLDPEHADFSGGMWWTDEVVYDMTYGGVGVLTINL